MSSECDFHSSSSFDVVRQSGLFCFFPMETFPFNKRLLEGREAALCSPLLRCWNSALSANPFNSAVFVVWVCMPLTSGWTLFVSLLMSVHFVLNCHAAYYCLCIVNIGRISYNNVRSAKTQRTAFTCGMLKHARFNLFWSSRIFIYMIFLFTCSFSHQPKRRNVCRGSLVEQQL